VLLIFWALIAKLWPFAKGWSDNNAEFRAFLVFGEIPVQWFFGGCLFSELIGLFGRTYEGKNRLLQGLCAG
jgi:hypothetical protein